MNCFCKTTVSARLSLYLKRLYFISSAIAYCISPYASFYAELSCSNLVLSKTTVYRFHYQQIISKYVSKARLGYTGTDSLVYLIETKNIYDDNAANISAFHTSEYPTTYPLHLKRTQKHLRSSKMSVFPFSHTNLSDFEAKCIL